MEGKVVVIMGASSGLGEAAVRLLSSLGATVVLGPARVERINSLSTELSWSRLLARNYSHVEPPAPQYLIREGVCFTARFFNCDGHFIRL